MCLQGAAFVLVAEWASSDRERFRLRACTLPHDGGLVVLKTTPANLDALMRADETTFSDEWRGRWLGIRLDRISLLLLRELLADSWRLAAPKRLAATLRSSGT
jgi:hypothetical protein